MKHAITILLSLLAVSLLSACVTSGDIRDLADAQEDFERTTTQALHEHQQGLTTTQEYAEDVGEARDTLAGQVHDIAEAVEERTQSAIDAAKTPITGNPIIDAVFGLVVTGLATKYAVNKQRDGRRKARNEAV